MGGIADMDVGWAIVNCLKAMLDAPPKTKFNVTQTFALFSSILLWSKNRAWVAGNHGQRRDWNDPADHLAHDAREALRDKMILDVPWHLSRETPRIILVDRAGDSPPQDQAINSDFESMTAESFFEWLRNALGHGDRRQYGQSTSDRRRQERLFSQVFVSNSPSRRVLLEASNCFYSMMTCAVWAASSPTCSARH